MVDKYTQEPSAKQGNIQGPKAEMLYLDVEASAAAATACSKRVIHDLELAPNQLHRVVHLTPLQQL